jgi:hypothetical protein
VFAQSGALLFSAIQLAGNLAIFRDPRVRPFAVSRSDLLLVDRIGYA